MDYGEKIKNRASLMTQARSSTSIPLITQTPSLYVEKEQEKIRKKGREKEKEEKMEKKK